MSYVREAMVGGKWCVAPPGDYFVTCSFDKNHILLRSRMPYHIVKCIKNFPDHKKKQCPFDSTEYIDQEDMYEHITKKCLSRENLGDDRYRMKELQEKGEMCKIHVTPFFHDIPETDEDWGATEEPTMDTSDDVLAEGVGRGTTKGSRAPLTGRGRAERLQQIWLQYQEKQRVLPRSFSKPSEVETSPGRRSSTMGALLSTEEESMKHENSSGKSVGRGELMCNSTKQFASEQIASKMTNSTSSESGIQTEARLPTVGGLSRTDENSTKNENIPNKGVGRGQIIYDLIKHNDCVNSSSKMTNFTSSERDINREKTLPSVNGLSSTEEESTRNGNVPNKGVGRGQMIYDLIKQYDKVQTSSTTPNSTQSESDINKEKTLPPVNRLSSTEEESTKNGNVPNKGVGRGQMIYDLMKQYDKVQTSSTTPNSNQSESDINREKRLPSVNGLSSTEEESTKNGKVPNKGVGRGQMIYDLMKQYDKVQTSSTTPNSTQSESGTSTENKSPSTIVPDSRETTKGHGNVPVKGLGRAKLLSDLLKQNNNTQSSSNSSSATSSKNVERKDPDDSTTGGEPRATSRPRRGISRGSLINDDESEQYIDMLLGKRNPCHYREKGLIGQFDDV